MLLGRIKFYLLRLHPYAMAVSQGMVVYLFFKESGISPWWLVVGIPACALVIWLDYKFVLQGELAEAFKQNPEWRNRNDKDSV